MDAGARGRREATPLILATGALFLAGEPGLAGIMLVAVVVNHELLATFQPKPQ